MNDEADPALEVYRIFTENAAKLPPYGGASYVRYTEWRRENTWCQTDAQVARALDFARRKRDYKRMMAAIAVVSARRSA